MGLFDWLTHWWRTRHVRRFERYLQAATVRHRYDPKPALKQRGITCITHHGQGAVLTYFPQTKELYYFSHDQIDPALIRLAETMLVLHLETPDDTSNTSYIVTMRDVTSPEGPADNRQWFHYMQALDRLMPLAVARDVRREVALLGKTPQLLYAYRRIFHLPMGAVKHRSNDAVLGIHHQTSFTDALILLKDKLTHDPRLDRPDHSAPPPSAPEHRGQP